MIIGRNEVQEILIYNEYGDLLASITDDEITEDAGITVLFDDDGIEKCASTDL